MEQDERAYQEQLKELLDLIDSDSHETISRLNSFLKICRSISGLIDPVSRTVITLSSLLSDLVDSIREEKCQVDSEDLNHKIVELIDIQHRQVESIHLKINSLIPKISVRLKNENWMLNFEDSRGVIGIVDHSNTEFTIIFSEEIDDYSNYFVHCSVTSERTLLTEKDLYIELPDVPNNEDEIKIYLSKMFDCSW